MFGISGICILGFFILAVIFVVCPQIDLWAANLFFDPIHRYNYNHTPAVRFIYRSVEILTVLLSTALLSMLGATWWWKKTVLGLSSKQLLYLILALMLGPGLVVNLFAKNMMGRARPSHIEEFGGSQVFTPAFVLSDQCERNCSFVSGHAALGFYLLSFSFVLPRHRRKILGASLLYGGTVGVVRMYQGGHFLSDVIFALCFVYFTSRLLYHLMFERYVSRAA